MEYGQELDKIKTEITNSGKKLEDLSKSIQNLSGLTKLQESINNFQEDNVLNRIETKIDILAQTDYSDIFNFSIDRINEKIENLSRISEGFENIQESLSTISKKINTGSNLPDSSAEDLAFLKENFYKINEKFSEISLLIRTNTGEGEELNNRFESNLTYFNSCFQKIYEQFNNLDDTFNSNFKEFKVCIQDVYDQFSTIDNRKDLDQIKLYVQSFSNKITGIADILETLKENNFSIKVENYDDLIKQKTKELDSKLDSVLKETQGFSLRMSDEFSSLVAPLSSAIELTCSLRESIDELISQDDMKVRKEASQLLNKFEDIYNNAENNLESLFISSKHLYEKLEKVKNELSDLSYDTSSKINDFISKTDLIDSRIQHTLASSESAIDSLKNISSYAENQINLTGESLNHIKTGVSELSEGYSLIKNDVTDLSSKINKIILSEKEKADSIISSFNSLKEELNKNYEANIENLSQKSDETVKTISNELKSLYKKLNETEQISSNTLDTAEDVKKALACIAEWFDSAGKLIEENHNALKKYSIEKIDSLIKRSEENITEQMKRTSDKFNRLEVRLENIEGKIEKLQEQYNGREVINILSDILEKVELSNERSKSDSIIRRLENIELKLEEIEDRKAVKAKKRIAEEKV